MTVVSKKIRACMLLKGITEAEIARRNCITQGFVSHVILGRRKSPRIRKVICDTINVPLSVWKEMDREIKAQKEMKR